MLFIGKGLAVLFTGGIRRANVDVGTIFCLPISIHHINFRLVGKRTYPSPARTDFLYPFDLVLYERFGIFHAAHGFYLAFDFVKHVFRLCVRIAKQLPGRRMSF